MAKPTWVFIVGPYRTGSTTQYLLAEKLLERTGRGRSIGYHTETRLEEEDHGEGYVLCKVFIPVFETSPFGRKFLDESRLKAIGTVRDPRDIFVSMRERDNGKGIDVGEEWMKERIEERFPEWLGNLNKWADLGSEVTKIIKFEDMIRHLDRTVQKIGDHLDIEVPWGLAREIAEECTIPALREQKQQYRQEGHPEKREHPVLPSIPPVVFGTSGHWRTWITRDIAERLRESNKTFFERWGY